MSITKAQFDMLMSKIDRVLELLDPHLSSPDPPVTSKFSLSGGSLKRSDPIDIPPTVPSTPVIPPKGRKGISRKPSPPNDKKIRRKLAAPKEFVDDSGHSKLYTSDRTCSYYTALKKAYDKYREVVPDSARLSWNHFRVVFGKFWRSSSNDDQVKWTGEPPDWDWLSLGSEKLSDDSTDHAIHLD